MHALSAAHELRLDTVIDQLLQDFLQVCPDDYSSQFVTECLPLLFNIFRYSKVSVISDSLACHWARTKCNKPTTKNVNFAERRHHPAVGRYFCNLFRLGYHQTDQRANAATGEWITYRSEIREQSRTKWCYVQVKIPLIEIPITRCLQLPGYIYSIGDFFFVDFAEWKAKSSTDTKLFWWRHRHAFKICSAQN